MTDIPPLTDVQLHTMVGSHRRGCSCIFCACAVRIEQDGVEMERLRGLVSTCERGPKACDAEIERLTNDLRRQTKMKNEMVETAVDLEVELAECRSTCDQLRTERDILRTTLGNPEDERKAARSKRWAAVSGSLEMCGNDCLHPECPSWGGAPCPGHARE